ncbi:MAG: hypothetical protein MUF43_09845 [Flavobacterium sp.]|jgi:hypothetical protein|nr:hypothetical protein [Flavobacterium sp.]MCU0393450.1 hypothetical protein [Thermoflexibacter sp.]
METIWQNRIRLIEQNYAPLKVKEGKEQLLKCKTANLEIYTAWFIGIACIIAWVFISYWALADILEVKPNNWDSKIGMVLGNSFGLLSIFLSVSRNGLILNHFLKTKEYVNEKSSENIDKLNQSFIKLLKGKELRIDMVICALLCFFSLFIFIYGQDNKELPLWVYMKYFLPIIFGVLIFRQLYYLYKIHRNIKEFENLVIYKR